ncbi:FAD-binding and (Fe-S)-binding domain-containing protein [Parasphingorhabdus pacifica]
MVTGTADSDITAFERTLHDSVQGRVSFDTGTRGLYTTDASNYRRAPAGVVLPWDTDDVIATVAACHEFGVPLVSRGGGTSIAGNAFGGGLLLDTSRYLTEIIEIDPQQRTAKVEPGVVLDDLRAAAEPYGLTFGPDPSTHSRCTLGGMIGNNACGSHSVAWGTTADNVESLDVLLPDGTRMTVGATGRDELQRMAAMPNRQGQIYSGVQGLVDRELAAIRTGMPSMSRRVSGYALDQLLPENGVHLARALTGTEGSCVVVLAATVRLVPTPPARTLVVLGYPDAPAAGDAVPELLERRPLTVEGLDRQLLDAWLSRSNSSSRLSLPDGQAWLMIEVSGADATDAAANGEAVITSLTGASRPVDARLITDPAEQRTLWRIREEGAGVATRLPDGSEAWPGLEDAAVPPENLGSYLRAFENLMNSHDRHGVVYGHFGEGCLHVRIDFNLVDSPGIGEFRSFMEQAADLITEHGGSLSGEHGDGQARSELLPRMYPPEICDAFAEFKSIWDPNDLMNPGVIVRPAPLDADLRVPAAANAGGALTLFSYPHDEGSFTQAVGRCVGVGKCRRSEGPGVMCPSYMATKEERHSTRGRARLLSEMLTGDLITDGWRSEEVREALDLCLSCKGCRNDCPVNVDMATYKAEFLHHHYAGRVRPAAHYSMGWLPLWSRFAALAPGLVNAATRNDTLSGLLKRIGGIAPERSIPSFAKQHFSHWFRRRVSRPQGRPPVLLWPDTFNNFLTPEVARAAVDVLEHAGFRVVLPRGPVCCGLTWVSTGQLGVARKVMRRTLAALAPFVEAGIPIVGLEPSCTAALRTDLVELVPGEDAERVAGTVHTLAEFLEAHAPDWQLPQVDQSAITQVHCHQHAVIGFGPDQELMRRAGIGTERVETGCCGLAGNFGFERGHYEVSQACGERALLPAAREAADGTLVLADGFSCRTQVGQATDRRAQHLAEVLAEAVRKEL